MSEINLNGEDFSYESKKFFNDGVAGKVNNVKLSIIKKGASESADAPIYKLVVSDDNGDINTGFFYPKEGDSDKKTRSTINRMIHVVRSVLGKDYQLPTVSSYNEAIDTLAKLISESVKGKTFNVYTNYGTKGYPKRYMQVRYFDFCELSTVPEADTVLRPKPEDLLERVQEDSPFSEGDLQTKASDNWL